MEQPDADSKQERHQKNNDISPTDIAFGQQAAKPMLQHCSLFYAPEFQAVAGYWWILFLRLCGVL